MTLLSFPSNPSPSPPPPPYPFPHPNSTVSSLPLLCYPNPNFTKPPKLPLFQTLKNPRSPLLSPPLSAVTSPPPLPSSSKLDLLATEFRTLANPIDRIKTLRKYSNMLPPFDDDNRTVNNRVMGCTSRVWVDVRLDEEGRVRVWADSDSEITKGFCGCLVWVIDGELPDMVLELSNDDLERLNFGGVMMMSRVNSWFNVLISIQKRVRELVANRDGVVTGEPFPSLVISSDGISANGSYALAQARYLSPNMSQVNQLVQLLQEKKIGIVAHFYMDPEVQGVLTAAQKQWPHIHISDSLVMADSAVKMAEDGCQFIAVLGVDFMSENVRAILDQAGFDKIGVYRMSDERIGCSLADAAAAPEYMQYLNTASSSSPSLHVIYINTSLETKAHAHELVPTITCTSSNVVQTILQAFAQIPDLTVYYGPDTYMGANIAELFQQMTLMTDEEIGAIHPLHNRDSVKSLLPRLQYFQDGACIVHDLFGHEVVEKIREMYCDAFLTAHFEVPGEMFSLAMEAKRRGMGVVGSTQNILDFIKDRLQESIDRNTDDHLRFILGTESGMITAIVAAVRSMFSSVGPSATRAHISVEIVFPVSSDSVTGTKNGSYGTTSVEDPLNLSVVPGVASGEGCSIHGGCASCPYMKMNSLGALLQVCQNLPDNKHIISGYEASRFSSQMVNGRAIADVGCEPILHMRHFQAKKELPDKLVHHILSTSASGKLTS